MINLKNQIESSWQNILQDELKKKYFNDLEYFLNKEIRSHIVYPVKQNLFSALNLCRFNNIKVVIMGQDPYHSPNQAHGLAFSVMHSKMPRSLNNVFKELNNDLNINPSNNGNLSSWAEQGVLLLNSILSVRKNQPGSHKKKGWENFTDAIIQKISFYKKGVVFLLWGEFAKKKKTLINQNKHFILTTSHPSPLSANKGFFGCKHFSKTNKILENQGLKTINWEI